MDLNTVRIVVTVLSFIVFIGIVLWSVAPKNRNTFERAKFDVLLDDSPSRREKP
jgi:cbb3-type cytochrome oxidase subunit 3